MQLRNAIRPFCLALSAALFTGLAAPVNAGDYDAGAYHQPPACHFVEVISYVHQRVKAVEWVTVHDHYGYPRRVQKIVWKIVTVPVKKQVKVCD